MVINRKKITLFILICVLTLFGLSIVVFLTYEVEKKKPVEYVIKHKNNWIEILENDNDILIFLENLYFNFNDLSIHYRNGKITINETVSDKFDLKEMEALKDLFIKFEWETIRLKNQNNTNKKIMEVISQQIIVSSFFQKHYGGASLVFSPHGIPDGGEEIFKNWYYIMLFNT